MIDPEVLLQGYRLGVFPMAMEDGVLLAMALPAMAEHQSRAPTPNPPDHGAIAAGRLHPARTAFQFASIGATQEKSAGS